MGIEAAIGLFAVGCIVVFTVISTIVVVKRFIIDKKYSAPSTQFIGEQMLIMHRTGTGPKAVQEIIYQKEDKEREDEAGEDLRKYNLPEDDER